jgi:peptidoglycan lytic transglycosylase
MSMRRAIGISLACLVTGACAIGKTPEEEGISQYPGETAGLPRGNGETPPTISSERTEQQFASFQPAADARDGIPEPCCRGWRTTGTTLLGKAAWYNFVGRQTASGEILDTVTATAAHRSLPLASYAKVTNLGNGHSVVVKINDRGPYTRGRILDLSPRAADALDVKRFGVAAVVVEPLVKQVASPTLVVFQTSGTAVSQ